MEESLSTIKLPWKEREKTVSLQNSQHLGLDRISNPHSLRARLEVAREVALSTSPLGTFTSTKSWKWSQNKA